MITKNLYLNISRLKKIHICKPYCVVTLMGTCQNSKYYAKKKKNNIQQLEHKQSMIIIVMNGKIIIGKIRYIQST